MNCRAHVQGHLWLCDYVAYIIQHASMDKRKLQLFGSNVQCEQALTKANNSTLSQRHTKSP